ncbi:MAG: hypothetical protein ACLP5E_22095 [Streptosporangiaceae bacterium]
MSAHDAVQTARAELTSAVAASQQLLDEHGKHHGYRTSAEWLTVVARNSQEVNSAARRYLEVTNADAPPEGRSRKAS